MLAVFGPLVQLAAFRLSKHWIVSFSVFGQRAWLCYFFLGVNLLGEGPIHKITILKRLVDFNVVLSDDPFSPLTFVLPAFFSLSCPN